MKYRKAEAKAAARAQFRGLWAAITTPFTPDNRIDEAGLRRNMRHFTDVLHVEGIFCTGTMGELAGVTRVDGRQIGDGRVGPMTRRLAALYAERTAMGGTRVVE